VVVALAAGAFFGLPQVSLAASGASTAAQGTGPGGPGMPDSTYLADALGITMDELTAAQQKAREAAIDQALEQGLITEAQAAALRSQEGAGIRGGLMMLLRLGGASEIDQEALLADALGISVEELQAAQQKAQQAAFDANLAQALEDGRITQAQADLMKARQALQQYIQEQGFLSKAVDAAVKAGVLTQEQADAILQSGQGLGGLGMRGFGMGEFGFGGPGGRGGGRGEFGCFGRGGALDNAAPDAAPGGTTTQ